MTAHGFFFSRVPSFSAAWRAWVAVACVSGLCAAPVLAETLRVGGTGSSAPLVERLFEEFRRQVPEATLAPVQPPLGSGGALKALAGGRIDIAFVGRALKPEEARQVGHFIPLASTAVVLVTQGGRRHQGFGFDDLAAVYDGKLQTWDDGKPIRLVLRASFESDTLTLKSFSPAMAAAVEAASRRPGMAMGNDDLETVELLRKTPGSLGPTTLGLLSTLDLHLTPLPLQGIAPTVENLQSGRYPWRKTLAVVLPVRSGPLAEKFSAFLVGEQAAAVLRRFHYLPEAR